MDAVAESGSNCCLSVCLFLCSRWSFVDVPPMLFSCPADHVPEWQPLRSLGMVEVRSVNVMNTQTLKRMDWNGMEYNGMDSQLLRAHEGLGIWTHIYCSREVALL